MVARLLPLAICAACCGQKTVATPVGVWVADIGSHPTGVIQALWQDAKLRLRRDGSFKI